MCLRQYVCICLFVVRESTNEIQHFYGFYFACCCCFAFFSFLFLIVVSQIEMGCMLPLLVRSEKFAENELMPQEIHLFGVREWQHVLCDVKKNQRRTILETDIVHSGTHIYTYIIFSYHRK